MTRLALILSLALALPANAGGPVIVEEAYEAEPAPRLTPGEKIAIAAGILILCAIACGSDGPDVKPGPVVCNSGC